MDGNGKEMDEKKEKVRRRKMKIKENAIKI